MPQYFCLYSVYYLLTYLYVHIRVSSHIAPGSKSHSHLHCQLKLEWYLFLKPVKEQLKVLHCATQLIKTQLEALCSLPLSQGNTQLSFPLIKLSVTSLFCLVQFPSYCWWLVQTVRRYMWNISTYHFNEKHCLSFFSVSNILILILTVNQQL